MKVSSKLFTVAGAIGFIGVVIAQQTPAVQQNLLSNASFEDAQAGWGFKGWRSQGKVSIDATETVAGKFSVRIENPKADDSFLKQTVTVKPHTRYRLAGFVKTMGVEVKGTGANISLEGGFEHTKSVTGDNDWAKFSFEFDSGPVDVVKVGPRLGHHSSMAVGVAWFDALTLVEVGPSPKGK